MTWGTDAVVAVLALMSLSVLAVVACALYRDRVMVRRILIEDAHDLIKRQYEAANVLMDDPATPPDVKAFVLSFCERLADPAVVGRIGDWLEPKRKAPEKGRIPDEVERVFTLVEGLRNHRDDLVQAFHEVLGAGVVGAVLRGSVDNATVYKALHLAAKVPDSRQREASRAVAASVFRPLNGGDVTPMPA